MRILFVSNLYPPHHLGGYELGCQEAVEGLKQRGHDVCVLTSMFGVGRPESDGEVYRWLERDTDNSIQPMGKRALRVLKKEIRNQRAFRRITAEFRPDLVYFWNLRDVSISLAFWAQRQGIPTCFYVFDNWIEKWWQDQWFALWPPAPRRRTVRFASHALQSLLRTLGLLTTDRLDLRHVHFASEFLKQLLLAAGEPVADAEVIYWGLTINQFPLNDHDESPEHLLVAGQIGPHKGIHTAIDALNILAREFGCTNLTLTIAGSQTLPDYDAELQRRVNLYGLEDRVRFTGFLPRERLTEVYRDHDMLLFPSVCDEGLGISILEAMASGMVVVGTASGGSAEVLTHDVTGLVFAREDAAGCAEQILRAIKDPQLCAHVRRNGRQMVEEKFTINRTIDNIERSLLSQIGGRLV